MLNYSFKIGSLSAKFDIDSSIKFINVSLNGKKSIYLIPPLYQTSNSAILKNCVATYLDKAMNSIEEKYRKANNKRSLTSKDYLRIFELQCADKLCTELNYLMTEVESI